jgi:hypothetical protein
MHESKDMTRPDLLKKINVLLDQAERDRTWGAFTIELRDGQPKLLLKTYQEKLTEDTPRGNRIP